MDMTGSIQHPVSSIPHRRLAFTLVELLVVITIIGILASLITVAAVGALRKSQETRIKVDLNQISAAFDEYKNKTTAYPPNCQTDDQSLAPESATSPTPLNEAQVLSDLKRHLKQVAPRHNEPDDLLVAVAGLAPTNSSFRTLPGGMTAGEAVVFWLGGFSSDPKYPISGEGGPSYRVRSNGQPENRTIENLANRTWIFPFEQTRLAPRAEDDYFDDSTGRYIEYMVTIPSQNNGDPQSRRINFWQYTPPKSLQPFLYFDTSRHQPTANNDPPAATAMTGLGANGQGLHVHALKKRSDSTGSSVPIQYIQPDKFQVLHCGIDDAWGEEEFEKTSLHTVSDINELLLFPDGPFTGEMADTIANFGTQTRLEDSQP